MKKLLRLVACILAVSLMSSILASAQEPQPQAGAGAAESALVPEDLAGDSSGDFSELSEEDALAILQVILQAAGGEEGTGDLAGDSSELSGEDAQAYLQAILQAMGGMSDSEGGEEQNAESAGESAGASAGGAAGALPMPEVPYGSPWQTAMDSGNIPEEAPAAVDDLILHYAYDTVKEHQNPAGEYNGMQYTANELNKFMTAYIQDESNDSHELQQLRIFYDQAADFDALKEAGLSELQPYLDMVAGAQSIEELNAVLSSEDFPFNPWTFLIVGAMAQDRDDNNGIFINPNFLFVSLQAEEMLVDSDDPVVRLIRNSMLMQNVIAVTDLLTAMGVPSDETSKLGNEMLALEKSYGSFCNSNDERLQEYGVYGDSVELFTLDELGERYQNFPITGILARDGKDKARIYTMQYTDWIATLDGLWTEDNLELLKCMTQVKVLMECKNMIDPDIFQVSRAALKQPDPEPQDQAYKACNNNMTFAQVLAKTYVEECLGQETVDRLTVMAQSLIGIYKDLIDATSWMGDASQQKILDKLDNMRLNILYPDGGYFNFDDLELDKTEDGGTLIGNYLKLKEYINHCQNELLDQKALCCQAWLAFPPTMVNAFYHEFDNSINIFPGIITSGVYRKDMTDSEMLGGIGYVVGHEISHAFDFRGSQMDHYGRPGSVFTEEDVEAFLKICDDLAAYYDTIEYMPDRFIDGKRIIAEAGADLNGMMVVLTYAQTLPEYNLEQVFEEASMIFTQVGPPGISATYAVIDSHPLGNLRVNVNAQMFDGFYDTYGVKEGDGMYLAPENRIRVWGE